MTQAPTLNYDILAEIFSAVEDLSGSGSHESRKQLFRAALICRAFQDPALDALWKSMDTIIPLLRLLPAIEEVNGCYTICGDINDQDMTRFNLYARRIRVLTLNRDSKDNQVAPFIFTVLPPLPALKHLVCRHLDQLNAPNTPLLLSSTLRRVDLLGDSSHGDYGDLSNEFRNISPFMYALHRKAPDIRRLALHSQTDPRLWQVVLRFRNLRSLQLSGVLDIVTFKNVASLPELQHLDVTMIDTSSLPVSSPTVGNDIITFLKLQRLRISGAGSTIASYVAHMSGGHLVDISITMGPDSSNNAHFAVADPWETCLSAMEAQWSSTLQSLRLDASEGSIQPSQRFFASLSKISLQSLVIEGSITMDQCPYLASSIPHVKVLCISRVTHVQGHARWDILRAFAGFCPQLTSLSIDIDISFFPSPSQRSCSNPSLKTLCIATNDVDANNFQHATNVARYLESMFPTLKSIETKPNNASAAFWKHVDTFVHKLQEVREDERKKHLTPVQRAITLHGAKYGKGKC